MPPRRARAPVPRKRPVQERATVTVDAIVTAVEQVLDRHGIAGLTTNRISEVAGVSVGTLYQYFTNKEALVAAVQERYLGQTLSMCRAALAAADSVPLTLVIERMGVALVAAHGAQRPIHRALIELRSAAGFQERYRAMLETFVDDVAAFLVARSDVELPDVRAAAYVLVHGIQGIVQATVAAGRDIDVRPIAAAAGALIRGYVSRR